MEEGFERVTFRHAISGPLGNGDGVPIGKIGEAVQSQRVKCQDVAELRGVPDALVNVQLVIIASVVVPEATAFARPEQPVYVPPAKSFLSKSMAELYHQLVDKLRRRW